MSVAIANGPYTGRAVEIALEARVDDGVLAVVCFLGYGPVELLKELAKVLLGFGWVRGHAPTGRSASRSAATIHADSIDVGTTPVDPTVSGGGLRVICPAKTA